MLSEEGRCFTFNATANGYARGEGVGAAFLVPWGQPRARGAAGHGGESGWAAVPR